jgi:hypothetical protein
MHFIILLGSEEQCQHSLRIIKRLETPSTQTITSNKKTSSNKVNHEEQTASQDELDEEVEEAEEEAGESEEDVGESGEEAQESTQEENDESFDDEMEKENVGPGKAASPSRVLTDSHQQSPRLNTG